jgi:sugar/nucleoside kinase (ribokinase family)
MSRFAGPQVLVIGELNVDIVATGLRSLPKLGAETIAADFALTLGSASAIFAAGISKLGHQVTFVSQVGEDQFGEFCISALEANGVSTDQIQRNAQVKTGATIALSGVRDRALVTYPGAIESFSYEQLNISIMKGHRHLHMTSYFLQKGLRSSFPQIFRHAKEAGLTTSFDPNSDPTGSWSNAVREVLRHTDVLFINQREAMQMTRSGTVQKALKILGDLVPCAVIKLGSKGATTIRGTEVTRAPGFKVNAVDTTGAGDSFDAGFISSYLRAEPLLKCLHQGNACGALSTLEPGGTAGQPDMKRLRKFLRSQTKNMRQLSINPRELS